MANAKKCDRCGGFFEIKYKTHLDDFALDLGMALGFKQQSMMEQFSNCFDFCPKCYESLKEWFNEGRKQKNE